jgi:hypothetical protein
MEPEGSLPSEHKWQVIAVSVDGQCLRSDKYQNRGNLESVSIKELDCRMARHNLKAVQIYATRCQPWSPH